MLALSHIHTHVRNNSTLKKSVQHYSKVCVHLLFSGVRELVLSAAVVGLLDARI